MFPAIFLDRDGVIIENRPSYIRSWEDVEIFPGALQALALLCRSPYKIVIVTNQSAVGRGILTSGSAKAINRRLVQTIEKAGGRIDGVFMCPHAPEDGCDCRKPKPGLLFDAASQLSLDLSRSTLIGDAISDLQAGKAAGIQRLALLRTGRGAAQALLPESALLGSFIVYETLADALFNLLRAEQRSKPDK